MPNIESTFETVVDAFVFLDKDKDGHVSKNEMVQAINESGEGSSGRIAMKRFGQLSLSLSIYIYIYIYIHYTRKCVPKLKFTCSYVHFGAYMPKQFYAEKCMYILFKGKRH